VRSEITGRLCPFGLPITEACEYAGSTILRMCDLSTVTEEQKEQTTLTNKRIYIYYRTNERCLFAANIVKEENAVNCDYGDTAQGLHVQHIEGSPLYPGPMVGLGLESLHAYPLGMYGDNAVMRNIPFGLYSLISKRNEDEIIKKSNKGES
jgi:hypothetical protein